MIRVFSGIQPSGNLHIGNYIGAIKQWVAGQCEKENYFCIVDLHAITVPQDPQILKNKIREIAGIYLASGVDSDRSVIFVQSGNQDHANLAWILNCITGMGQLERMTQYKDKSSKQEVVGVGLFGYPVLMAADILLYDIDEVPVGDDQKQHVELTRDLAERFNSRFGLTFKLPEPIIAQNGARIMSLQNPLVKMSKSDQNEMGAIFLLENPEIASKKIMKAVTDSGSEIKFGEDKPAISNLLTIYSQISGMSIEQIEKEFEGRGYGDFKKSLADVIYDFLINFQIKYNEVVNSGVLEQVLASGLQKAQEASSKKMIEVNEKVGLG